MRLINMTCPGCGSQLKVDADEKQAKCEFCGKTMLIDDGVQHIQYDNAESAGYEFEKGRQRAIAETNNMIINSNNKTKRKTWLWVLGWIFIFPVPLTLVLIKKDSLDKKIKYGILAAAWVLYFIFVIAAYKNPNRNSAGESRNSVNTGDVNKNDKSIENPLESFYKDFSESGTGKNIKEMVDKYGLFVDSRNNGTGKVYYKIAETADEAKVIDNNDAFTGDYYVRIEYDALQDEIISVEFVDDRK